MLDDGYKNCQFNYIFPEIISSEPTFFLNTVFNFLEEEKYSVEVFFKSEGKCQSDV